MRNFLITVFLGTTLAAASDGEVGELVKMGRRQVAFDVPSSLECSLLTADEVAPGSVLKASTRDVGLSRKETRIGGFAFLCFFWPSDETLASLALHQWGA